MWLLNGYKTDGKQAYVFILGFVDKACSGFKNNEPICEIDPPNFSADEVNINVTKQIGFVSVNQGQVQFNYTDEEFKASINFSPETGYSSLDGGIIRTITGPTVEFMYTSAHDR